MYENFDDNFEIERTEKLIERYETILKNKESIYLDSGDFVDIIEYYTENQNISSANRALEYALGIHPNNAELLVSKARLAIIENDDIGIAEEIINSIPDKSSEKLNMLKFEILVYKEDPKQAHQFWLKYTENFPNDSWFYSSAGQIFSESGYFEESIFWYEKAIQITPNDDTLIMPLAEVYYDAKKKENAEKIFNQLLDKAPYNSDYWIRFAEMFERGYEFEKAIEAYEYALAADEDKEKVLYLPIGNCYSNLGNHKKAGDFFYKHASLEDENRIYNFYAGMAYYYAGLCDLSKNVYKEFINYEMNNPTLTFPFYAIIADHFNNMGATEEALHLIDKAIEREEEGEFNLNIIKGKILLAQNKIDEAVDYFGDVLINDPSEYENYIDISYALLEKELYQEVIYCLNELESLSPLYEKYQILKAYSYLKLGNKDLFTIYFKKAFKDDRDSIQKFIEHILNKESPECINALRSLLNKLEYEV